jgi:hypothetical protein
LLEAIDCLREEAKMDQEQNEKAWATIIRTWKESGKSQREFCRAKKISFWTFRNWRTKLLRRGTSSPSLVELSFANKPLGNEKNDLRIHFPSGIVIEAGQNVSSERLSLVLKAVQAL